MTTLATAVVKSKANSVRGGFVTYHTVSLDPASVAAAAVGGQAVTVVGVKTGDMVFVCPGEALAAQLIAAGAKVTAADEVTIYLANTIDATTAINDTAKTYNLLVVHLS